MLRLLNYFFICTLPAFYSMPQRYRVYITVIVWKSAFRFLYQAKQSIFAKLSVMNKCFWYKHIVNKISLELVAKIYSQEICKIFDNV